jgi:hypothetical protein
VPSRGKGHFINIPKAVTIKNSRALENYPKAIPSETK